jgi:crossover junction endodeoxyribonuclease RusA
MELKLPWPPSVNELYGKRVGRNKSGKPTVFVYTKKPGTEFRDAVRAIAYGCAMVRDQCSLTLLLCPPDRRARDIDNILKATLDALQHARVIENDVLVRYLVVEWGPKQDGGAVFVKIEPMARRSIDDEQLEAFPAEAGDRLGAL